MKTIRYINRYAVICLCSVLVVCAYTDTLCLSVLKFYDYECQLVEDKDNILKHAPVILSEEKLKESESAAPLLWLDTLDPTDLADLSHNIQIPNMPDMQINNSTSLPAPENITMPSGRLRFSAVYWSSPIAIAIFP